MDTNDTSRSDAVAPSGISIDWTASKESWIEEARAAWGPRLLNDGRFPDASKLLKRFDHEVDVWRAKRDREYSFRQVVNFGNEVSAAVGLLDHVKDLKTLRYEPRIPCVRQSLDFLIINESGNRAWIDVKTVAPQWIDDEQEWQRFLAIRRGFPFNTHFGVQREFCGAAIGGQSIKTRWSFVARTRSKLRTRRL